MTYDIEALAREWAGWAPEALAVFVTQGDQLLAQGIGADHEGRKKNQTAKQVLALLASDEMTYRECD